MTLIEQSGEAELISRFVPALTERPLEDVANDPEVVASYTQWQATAAPYEARVKARAKLVGGATGAVLVDLTDELSDAAPKFVTYALYPDSAYSVVVTRGAKKIKLSIGFNPWCGQIRKHDIAKICERHGGGGHPVQWGQGAADHPDARQCGDGECQKQYAQLAGRRVAAEHPPTGGREPP